MTTFPAVDPIPLPAPVWLFKILHVLTMALHFITVEMLLGGLAAALILNLASRGRGPAAGARLNASAALARRLPIVMTYVINLGVPPLLFAQVLYGRALYTSSVLIGIWWIAVIFLLIGCYWHIYRFTAKIEEGRRAWPMALISLGLALLISRIYSTNMTLMLHPEAWQQLYAASALGAQLPAVDPALMPRWLFMLVGGLAAGGLWMIWLAGQKSIEPEVRAYLSATGGRMAVVTLPVQLFLAYQVLGAQPESIRQSLTSDIWFRSAALAWLAGAALLTLVAAWCAAARPTSRLPGLLALVLGLVGMLGMATCRDVLRDVTLLSHGFNVWDRHVAANWPVISVFLLSFVAGLVCVGWLIAVFLRAKPIVEKPVA
jgi:hypothetical protein